MTNITKHDGKEERESNDGEQSGVDLLVGSDSVGVYDGLESVGELVGAVEGGGIFVRAQLVEDGAD